MYILYEKSIVFDVEVLVISIQNYKMYFDMKNYCIDFSYYVHVLGFTNHIICIITCIIHVPGSP